MGGNTSKLLLSMGAGGAASLLIYSFWKVDKPQEPPAPFLGLQNSGNSCFLNAILQALASCRFMLGWLRQKDEDCNYIFDKPVAAIESYNGISYPLIAALFRAILIMNRDIEVDDNLYTAKVPGDVLNGLRCHGHRIGVQQEQDAYEVFAWIAMSLNHEVELSVRRKQTGSMSALTDGLSPEDRSPGDGLPPLSWRNNVVSRLQFNGEAGDWDVVGDPAAFRVSDHIFSKRQVDINTIDYKKSPKNPFRCLLFSQMQCIVCMAKTKIRTETAESLTLTLPPPEQCTGLTIEELFAKNMKPTLVHNVDCDTCTSKSVIRELRQHVQIKSSFLKYNYMAKLPNSLCIHIPRVTWSSYGMIKRTDYVSFPERINLAQLKRLYDTAAQDQDALASNMFIVNAATECGLRRFQNSEYHLTAVISHYGSDVDSGHFVTFRKKVSPGNPNLSSWYYISDDIVRPVALSCVLATKAYLLFYEKTFAKE